jgi:serine/threonine protein kinase
MAFIEGPNLKDFIEAGNYDPAFVKKVSYTLYQITEALLEKGIAHRDIKPENIMVSAADEVILMDLGVLKLIGVPSFSDLEDKQFVGTLRYAPPEFLTRHEQDNLQGWQAINRYQIGAVMHDLIMKRELFNGISPYSNLVIAIKEDAPTVSSQGYPFETVQLARDLLTKDPQSRLKLTPAQRITNWAKKKDANPDDVSKELEGLLQMTSGHKAKLQEIENIRRSTQERKEIRANIANKLADQITGCFIRLKEIGGCELWSVYKSFTFQSDEHLRQEYEVRNLLFEISGNLEKGFSQPLYLLVRLTSNERSEAEIGLLGILLAETFKKTSQTTPMDIFRQVLSERNQGGNVANQIQVRNPQVYFNLEVYEFFNGIVEFDKQLEDKLLVAVMKIIKKALSVMEKEVNFQLSLREKQARGENTSYSRTVNRTSTLIHKLD